MDEQTSLSADMFGDVSEADIAEMTESDTPKEETTPSENEGAKEEENGNQIADDGKEQPEATPSEEESYTLTHLGKEVKLSRDEMIRVAQKGLDYDRVRGSYDRIGALARSSSMSVDDFIDTLDKRANETVIAKRAEELLNSGEYSENSARQMAEMELRLNKQEKADKERMEAESKQNAFRQSIGNFVMNNPEFLKEFPDAKLPDEMVESLNNGMNIDGAWAKYQLAKERQANEEMKKQLAQYEQIKKNKESAAPSIKADKDGGEKDPFLEGLMMGRW